MTVSVNATLQETTPRDSVLLHHQRFPTCRASADHHEFVSRIKFLRESTEELERESIHVRDHQRPREHETANGVGTAHSEARKLHTPWFSSQLASLRAVLILESPAGFRSRNLFISENALTRA